MEGRTIADMFFEAVERILSGNFDHVVVAGDFSDDRSGGDGWDEGIGFRQSGDMVG